MSYTIQNGDSLWGIATQQCGAKSVADIQKTIDKLVELNNLGSENATIFTGASLKLPTDTFESSAKEQNVADSTTGNAANSTNNNTVNNLGNNLGGNTFGSIGGTLGSMSSDTDSNTIGNTTLLNKPFFALGGEEFEFLSFPKENQYKEQQEYNIFSFIDMLESASGLEKLLSGVTSIFATSETEETQETTTSESSSSKETKEEEQQKYEEKLKSTANGQFKSLDEQETVSYDNFMDWYNQGLTAKKREVYAQNEGQLKTAFDALDKNGDSNLDATEIEDMYEAFNKIDQEIDKMIKRDKLDNTEEEQKTLANA